MRFCEFYNIMIIHVQVIEEIFDLLSVAFSVYDNKWNIIQTEIFTTVPSNICNSVMDFKFFHFSG